MNAPNAQAARASNDVARRNPPALPLWMRFSIAIELLFWMNCSKNTRSLGRSFFHSAFDRSNTYGPVTLLGIVFTQHMVRSRLHDNDRLHKLIRKPLKIWKCRVDYTHKGTRTRMARVPSGYNSTYIKNRLLEAPITLPPRALTSTRVLPLSRIAHLILAYQDSSLMRACTIWVTLKYSRSKARQ